MKLLLALLASCILCVVAGAQTLAQPVKVINLHPATPAQGSYTQTIYANTAIGDTEIVVLRPLVGPTTIMDTQNNTLPQNNWTLVPGTQAVWTKISAGGPLITTVSYPQEAFYQAVYADYIGTMFVDQVAHLHPDFTSSEGMSFAITPTQPNELVIGYGWNWTANSLSPAAELPFTMEGIADGNTFLEDLVQTTPAAISSSVVWNQSVEWEQGVISFALGTPPSNFAVTGSILFNDTTVFYTGALTVDQWNGSNAWIPTGAVNVSATGTLSGSIVIDPSYVDSSGNVGLQFTIPGIAFSFTQTFALAEFQQNETGLTMNLVIFKTPFMNPPTGTLPQVIVKSLNLALTP